MHVLLATRNAHKVHEIAGALAALGWTVAGLDTVDGLPEELPETGDTFEANALQKARFVAAATGLAALADDSGLEVAALGWGPGVYSRRFSPEATDQANNALLLRRLAGVDDRAARYRCALALVLPDGREGVVDGACPGRIGQLPRGQNGFGYDPLFWPDDAPGRTMAELTLAEKNQISHRGRALSRLPGLIAGLGPG